MTRLHPDDLADQRANPNALDPRPVRDLWIAGLVGAIAGGFSMLLMFAAIDGLPHAGKLNGCEGMTATDCMIFAQEGR